MTDHHQALLRHFADLRDGNHGGAATTRRAKEELFAATVDLLDPVARRVLADLDARMLLGRGSVTATGLIGTEDGGKQALWALSWPEQARARVAPVVIRAHYGAGFHHPHLSGGTVGEWPLNVFSAADAEAEEATMRAIVSADLHNLVFQADFRIVPATTAGR
ncbi:MULTISPECIES: hypothetical protein [Actinosynnema]|uniref:hypothetical protein n=1 Tax=Actinosynnema TaxID=40566 RepID=UPI0020A527EC|nr:hypothetical protein [Actinosynnema pretiosum]MCP2094566.1 hypothetical protein [Actinosynnema pretiosum]